MVFDYFDLQEEVSRKQAKAHGIPLRPRHLRRMNNALFVWIELLSNNTSKIIRSSKRK